MTCWRCNKHFCWVCLKIIENYEHFSSSPQCWNTLGQRDALELNTSDIEEVKENIGETDMQNSVLCPICKNCVKKRTEINEIECDACKNILCFY